MSNLLAGTQKNEIINNQFMLDAKLQLKSGQTVALVNNSFDLDIKAAQTDIKSADVIIVFVISKVELAKHKSILLAAAKRGAVPWVAYPKAKQLGTDLNRDIVHKLTGSMGLKTIRQIAINETWSALRLKLF